MRAAPITVFVLLLVGCLGCDDGAASSPDAAADSVEIRDADALSEEDVSLDAAPDGDASDAANDVGAADADDGSDVELREIPPEPWSVFEDGPYGVGYRELYIEYQPNGIAESRRLRLVVWYPTLELVGYRVHYLDVVRRDTVFNHADPAPGPFPVMIFSHGSFSFAEQSYFLTEFFASHGWIVAAPDHTGNTYKELDEPLPPEVLFLRPQDVSAVLDQLESFPADDPLAGVAGEPVVVSGHSFGGYTSLAVAGATYAVDDFLSGCGFGAVEQAVCDSIVEYEDIFRAGLHDPRVDLIVPQAPGGTMAFGPGLADIDVPVMLFTGALDATTPDYSEGDPAWDALDGATDMRVEFATGGHFTFSNACEMLPGIAVGDGCGFGYVADDEALPAINAYSLAFIRSRLFGDTSVDGFLGGDPVVSSDITLHAK